jgi:hypothetical protein
MKKNGFAFLTKTMFSFNLLSSWILLGSFFQLPKINAQTHYFAYNHVVNDTLKMRDSAIMNAVGPIDIPMKMTNARCYVYQNSILAESDSTLHSRFSKISTMDKVLYPAGLNAKSVDSPIQVYDLKSRKFWSEREKKGYILPDAPAPKPIKRKDGRFVYMFNDVCYVITDPKLSNFINPGVMWTGMQGGVVEIKTVHHKYELIFHVEDKLVFKNKEIDYIIQKLKQYQTQTPFVPYLLDTNPTRAIVGTFTPEK